MRIQFVRPLQFSRLFLNSAGQGHTTFVDCYVEIADPIEGLRQFELIVTALGSGADVLALATLQPAVDFPQGANLMDARWQRPRWRLQQLH